MNKALLIATAFIARLLTQKTEEQKQAATQRYNELQQMYQASQTQQQAIMEDQALKDQKIKELQQVVNEFDCTPQVQKALAKLQAQHDAELQNMQLNRSTIESLYNELAPSLKAVGVGFDQFSKELTQSLATQGIKIQ